MGNPFPRSRDGKLAKIPPGLDILAKPTAKQEPRHRLGARLLISNGAAQDSDGNVLQDLCLPLPTRELLRLARALWRVIILLLRVHDLSVLVRWKAKPFSIHTGPGIIQKRLCIPINTSFHTVRLQVNVPTDYKVPGAGTHLLPLDSPNKPSVRTSQVRLKKAGSVFVRGYTNK